MTHALLVAVAHGLDLLTFLMAVSIFGMHGEANPIMRATEAQMGMGGVIALKGSGTAAISFITAIRPRWVLLAAGAGIVGATVNLVAIIL